MDSINFCVITKTNETIDMPSEKKVIAWHDIHVLLDAIEYASIKEIVIMNKKEKIFTYSIHDAIIYGKHGCAYVRPTIKGQTHRYAYINKGTQIDYDTECYFESLNMVPVYTQVKLDDKWYKTLAHLKINIRYRKHNTFLENICRGEMECPINFIPYKANSVYITDIKQYYNIYHDDFLVLTKILDNGMSKVSLMSKGELTDGCLGEVNFNMLLDDLNKQENEVKQICNPDWTETIFINDCKVLEFRICTHTFTEECIFVSDKYIL